MGIAPECQSCIIVNKVCMSGVMLRPMKEMQAAGQEAASYAAPVWRHR
jgi:hypothetical protein